MSEPYLGEIDEFGFNFAPRGWNLCDGQILAISQYTALFSLLGTTFGGDGRTTFALPDLRSRSTCHVGSGPGLEPERWGEKSGGYETTLTLSNLAYHNHTLMGSNEVYNAGLPTNALYGTSPDDGRGGPLYPIYNIGGTVNLTMHTNILANTGGNIPFNILNPYEGIYTAIAMVGVFPSRS